MCREVIRVCMKCLIFFLKSASSQDFNFFSLIAVTVSDSDDDEVVCLSPRIKENKCHSPWLSKKIGDMEHSKR